MFTVRENMAFFGQNVIAPRASHIKKTSRNVALIFLVSLLLEIFVFNFNYFASLGNTPIDLASQIKASQSNRTGDDGKNPYVLTSDNHVLEFHNIDTTVNSLLISLDTTQVAQAIEVKLQFTDDAHISYFDTTEYTAGIPDQTMSTALSQTQYIRLNCSGQMHDLRIEIVTDDADYDVQFPLYLNSIYLNPNRPFNFIFVRFLAAFFILMLVYIFRPKSSIYKINIREHDFTSKTGIIAGTAIEIWLAITFCLFGSNLVGVATSSYNYGDWDGKSLINTYEVGGDNAQQYAELAKALAKGQVYLDEEPPQWLQDLDTPYDKASRDEAQKASGQDYLFDVAYFNGHYYVYFGVVPVLLFYLPFYLVTGANFPTAIGVLISVIMWILGITALLHRFAKHHFERVNLGIFMILQIAIVTCSGALYLLKFPTFYSLPIALALAFTVWGLYFWMRGRKSPNRKAFYLAGSACMALVLGCRPQLFLLSLVAFPLFWRPYISMGRIKTKDGLREFICLIAPYVVVGAGLMIYNYARFGSPFDFGANYNLTVNDMTKRGMNIGRIAPAIFSYFFQTPATMGVFPFLQQTTFETTYVGQTIREATFGGIFACLPITWLIFIAYPALKVRNLQRKTRTVTGVVWVLLICGTLIAILDAEMAGILQRYYADFSFMFIAAAVLIAL